MAGSEVKLLVDFSGAQPVYEMVPAEEIGANRFRITASPGFAPGVASGDEIELDQKAGNGYRILKRSGNICIQLFLNKCSSGDRQQITNIIKSIHGWLDGGKDNTDASRSHLLIFTIPFATGFSVIEDTMSEISKQFDVDSWMYGNVYDVDGHTPLEWLRNHQ